METYQYFCNVTQAGVIENGNAIIGLVERENQWGTLQFLAAEGANKPLLATALAAMTAGIPVWVQIRAPKVPAGNDLKEMSGVVERMLLIKG